MVQGSTVSSHLSFGGKTGTLSGEVKSNGGLGPKSQHVVTLHRFAWKMTKSILAEATKMPGD